ncbi:MAG: TfoX/Sxy family protein [Actinobacteria bacterium]|nr:TfoX/Sxy family protein [Actinomycetota bacterium]
MPAPADQRFVEFVLDRFSALDGVTARAMFGGHGLSLRGSFFAIAYDGRLYFKTSRDSVVRYEAAGMAPFRPAKGATIRS